MTYRTIVADPPWPQKGGGPLRGREGFLDADGPSLDLPYSTMTLDQIGALTTPAADEAHLYLWTTSGFLGAAFRILHEWGFTYSTTLVWAKAPIGHGLGGAYGIATEFVLFARRGSLPSLSKVGRNWFDWKRPYDERGKPRHSAKPPEFYAMVEQVSPGPYLEMFARDFRLGWDAWGDQAPNAVVPDPTLMDPQFDNDHPEGPPRRHRHRPNNPSDPVDAAWEAFVTDLYFDDSNYDETVDRHRPLITAAIDGLVS